MKKSCQNCGSFPADSPNRIREPALPELIERFTDATIRWAALGFPVVTENEFRQRLDRCRKCPEWNPNGWMGWGTCRACGCTKAKLWLATETCPLARW